LKILKQIDIAKQKKTM